MEAYDDTWVEEQVAQTVDVWRRSAAGSDRWTHPYTSREQEERERAYDDALEAVEEDLRCESHTRPEHVRLRDRMIASFGEFAARALDLQGDAIELLTQEFLPVGTELARRARRFDPMLGMAEVIQAARNAWTACGLQPLLGRRVALTPSIFGYSMMYPYSDNYLDDEEISAETKLQFSRRFRRRLLGERVPGVNHRERAVWKLIALIERQYPRACFPRVFECLLAIHQKQEQSIRQLCAEQPGSVHDVLQISCAKGGTSVLADACLVRGSLSGAESRFAFQWGVLLQLGDDLQDVRDDLRRGSATIFSRAATSGKPLDEAALQLLSFSEEVGKRMDELPCGSATLKELLKMSWRSLIIRAIADSHEFFSPSFLGDAERCSPFRFDFLRRRADRLASRDGLYATLFGDLVESSVDLDDCSREERRDWLPEEEPDDSEIFALSD